MLLESTWGHKQMFSPLASQEYNRGKLLVENKQGKERGQMSLLIHKSNVLITSSEIALTIKKNNYCSTEYLELFSHLTLHIKQRKPEIKKVLWVICCVSDSPNPMNREWDVSYVTPCTVLGWFLSFCRSWIITHKTEQLNCLQQFAIIKDHTTTTLIWKLATNLTVRGQFPEIVFLACKCPAFTEEET